MCLDSISKELYIWYVLRNFADVKCCWGRSLYVLYGLHSSCHVLNYFMYFLRVKMELAMSSLPKQFYWKYHTNVVLYNKFEELILMINYNPWCLIFIPIHCSQSWDGRTAFGEPKVSSTLGGFNIDFLVFLLFFPYRQKKFVE